MKVVEGSEIYNFPIHHFVRALGRPRHPCPATPDASSVPRAIEVLPLLAL
jgi:hypothetical protein